MLTPIILTDEELDEIVAAEQASDVEMPSKTYRLDMENGRLYSQLIDDKEAIKQAVAKAIKTMRDKYIIYSSAYGCEIFYLLGEYYSLEYLNLEIPRLIDEALMDDERIDSTENYVITRENDELGITFDVNITLGESVTVEVTI